MSLLMRDRPEARTGPQTQRRGVTVVAPALSLAVSVERDAAGNRDVHFHAGGQGFWVARMIATLGGSVTLCAPLGGEPGRVLHGLVSAEGVQLRGVDIGSWSSVWLSEGSSGDDATIVETPVPALSRHELDDLYGAALTSGLSTGLCVLTGTKEPGIVPSDLYQRLAGDLGSNGAEVIVDLSGDDLTNALAGRPALVKVAHDELIASDGPSDDSIAQIVSAMERMRADGAQAVLVSRAGEPALCHLGETLLEISGPRFGPLNHRGAGDSMTAAIATSRARGDGFEDAIRLAAAAGALNVTRQGLGTGDRRAIERLVEHVRIRPLDAATTGGRNAIAPAAVFAGADRGKDSSYSAPREEVT